MKIVDCFLFYNELDLLKFKLKELNDIVDYFVLIESKYTFVGNEKELYYERVDKLVILDILERLEPILDNVDYSDLDWATKFLDEALTLD